MESGTIKRGIPRYSKNAPVTRCRKLNHRDVRSCRAFLTLLDVKRDLVAFAEGFKPAGVDRRVVNEHIRSIFLLDEAESLVIVKPFNSSISHVSILLSLKFQRRKLEDVNLANGLFPQKETVPAGSVLGT